MGIRFRKSFKIAPGLKFNINKNSVGVTMGVKGAHYTINSKGKRTSSIGIPGTGLSYVSTEGGGSSKHHHEDTHENITADIDNRDLAPIEPIDTNIKDPKKKWKWIILGAAILVIVLSILLSQTRLSSLDASWSDTSFEIGETAKVKITSDPANYDLSNIRISNSDFASLKFSDGIATITFKKEGSASLYFVCDDVASDAYRIKVIDPVAEEQRQKEAQEKAEEEARLEAERQVQEEAERQAAQQQAAAQQQSSQQQTAQQPTQSQMVWIPQSGSKYHSNSSCSNMKNPSQVTLDYAQSSGYEPCKKCY